MQHCPDCTRHYFATETVCPFCASSASAAAPSGHGVIRQVLVSGAAAVVLAGCPSTPVYGPAPMPTVSPLASASPSPPPTAVPVYGPPPMPNASP